MYNLLISGHDETWEKSSAEFDRTRIIQSHEYTAPELAAQYGGLTPEVIEQITRLPCLFAYESRIEKAAKVGYIRDLRFHSETVIIDYEIDRYLPQIQAAALWPNRLMLDIRYEFECNRSHWALKDVDLFEVLERTELATSEQIAAARGIQVRGAGTKNQGDIFIVHGHDDLAKTEVARFVENLGLRAIILHEQPNRGATIIDKFESHADKTGFAIVLLTPDDIGYAKTHGPDTSKDRPRLNVVLELGFFRAKLGKENLCLLQKDGVEIPNDISGVVYTPMDGAGGWKLGLAQELKAAGYEIDTAGLFNIG